MKYTSGLFFIVFLALLVSTLSQQGQCPEITFCDVCQLEIGAQNQGNTTICTTCIEGYIQNADKTICVQECPQLTPISTCGCHPELVNDNGFCTQCFVDNCRLCSIGQSDKCDFCKSGYKLQEDGSCKVQCPSETFGSCQCDPRRQVLKNGQCIDCNIQNCALCQYNDENICDICRDGFFSVNGQCIECSVSYCLRCKDDGTNSKCQVCQDGYLLNPQTQQCQLQGCTITGQSFDGSICRCPSKTYLSQDQNSCIQCQENCLNCDKDGCNQCLTKFYISFQGDCQQCSSNCLQCQNSNKCQQCVDGFSLNLDGACQSGDGINQCEGQNNQRVSLVCPGNCLTCSCQGICQECDKGYAINKGQCQPCDQNCKTCLATNSKLCLSCYSGKVYQDFWCYSCPENCITCSGKDFCTECQPNYFSNQGTCEICPDFCIQCDSGTDGCTECEPGYTLIQKQCVSCLVGCIYCSSRDVAVCFRCDNGYYLATRTVNDIEQKNCQICPTGCGTCQLIDGQVQCQSCRVGYDLFDDNKCYLQCQFPCNQCQRGQPTNCTSCFGGYLLSNDNCIASISCNTTGDCVACPADAVLINRRCFPCNYQIDFCSSCSNQDVSKCTGCVEGYYLKNAQCIQCSTGCVDCSSASYCKTCEDGYYSVLVLNQPTGLCRTCTSNCLTCQLTSSTCTSCDTTKFELQGTKCLSLNRVILTVVILYDYFNFMGRIMVFKRILFFLIYPNRTVFIASFINFNFLGQGSVQLQMRLQTTEQESIQQVASNVKSQVIDIDDNKPFGEQFPLQTAPQIQLIEQQQDNEVPDPQSEDADNQTDTEEDQNLGLILGLSIPIGLISLIALFLYMKKSSQDSNKLQVQSTSRFTGLDEI